MKIHFFVKKYNSLLCGVYRKRIGSPILKTKSSRNKQKVTCLHCIRRFQTLLLFILLGSFVGVGRTEGLPPEFNNGTDSHVDTKNESLFHFSQPIIDHNYAMVFAGGKNEYILSIDSDGDIFLRGKWIGCDRKLPSIIKKMIEGLH